jgi:hypothetical protein
MAFEATCDKVNEAQHFLVLMRVAELPPGESGVPARLQGEDAYRYALSAFMSAARTTLHLLQEEGAGVGGFTRWYVSARDSFLRQDIVRLFGDRREFKLVFPNDMQDVSTAPTPLALNRVGPLPDTQLPAIHPADFQGQVMFRDRMGASATELCAAYLDAISTLVEEALGLQHGG